MRQAAAYLCVTSPFADRLIASATTPRDRAVAEQHHRPLRQRQSLAARACLRVILERHTGIPGAEWRIERAENGAPHVSAAGCLKSPAVSISHSADLVACAMSFSGRIGIDIEQMRADRDIAALAALVFSPAEADDAGRSLATFYRAWAQREALMKAAGDALPHGVSLRDLVQLPPAERYRFCNAYWQWRNWELDEGYVVAIAFEETADARDLSTLDQLD